MSPTAVATSPEAEQPYQGAMEDDEEDYMTMAVPDTQADTKPETSHQRRLRQQREAEVRARPKSKAEIAAEAERAREIALTTSIEADPKSKGAKMMSKLGYKPGDALGAPGNVHARLEPIGLEMKEGKEGVGAMSERKRKFREEVEREGLTEKRRKEDEGDFRERVAKDRADKRAEGQWWGAMKVLEGLDEEKISSSEDGARSVGKGHARTGSVNVRARDVPLLYRPLVVDRRHRERESRRRHDMIQSLSRNRTYDDPDEDAHDKQALGTEIDDEEEEDEDEDLRAYAKLPASERLEQLVGELREKWLYCFWCKYRYGSKDELESECPGGAEDEHG